MVKCRDISMLPIFFLIQMIWFHLQNGPELFIVLKATLINQQQKNPHFFKSPKHDTYSRCTWFLWSLAKNTT